MLGLTMLEHKTEKERLRQEVNYWSNVKTFIPIVAIAIFLSSGVLFYKDSWGWAIIALLAGAMLVAATIKSSQFYNTYQNRLLIFQRLEINDAVLNEEVKNDFALFTQFERAKTEKIDELKKLEREYYKTLARLYIWIDMQQD